MDADTARESDEAARIIYAAMSWASGLPGPSGETIPEWDDPASAIFRDKARDAARKSSTVALEAEWLRFEGDLAKWLNVIGTIMDASRHELVSLRDSNTLRAEALNRLIALAEDYERAIRTLGGEAVDAYGDMDFARAALAKAGAA